MSTTSSSVSENDIVQINRRQFIRVTSMTGLLIAFGTSELLKASPVGDLLKRIAKALAGLVSILTLHDLMKKHPEYAEGANLFPNQLKQAGLVDLSPVYQYAAPPVQVSQGGPSRFAYSFFGKSYVARPASFFFSGDSRKESFSKAGFFNLNEKGYQHRTILEGPTLAAVSQAFTDLSQKYSPAEVGRILVPVRPLTSFQRTYGQSYEDPDIYFSETGKVEVKYTRSNATELPYRDKKGHIKAYAGVGAAHVTATRSDGAVYWDHEYTLSTLRYVR